MRAAMPTIGAAVMQQVSNWLEKLGLGQYAQRFAENDISFSVLTDLTDQDLKEIGVSLGHRRQLLRAIAELPNREKDAPKAAPAALASAAQDMAERRQVTVMFSDLVGSTALSVRMDHEDLREVISAYQKCVTEIVQRFGGFVAKYMGDGVLVYFGYPQAHEDDAERAVRAGLQLAAALGDLKTHAALQTRVGIATGLVVVGDLIGSGEAQERGIVGETPNLAARLQGLAQPNSVVVAESTRKLLGNLFELEDLGARDLKGITGPLRAWTALRPSAVASRFEALHAIDLTELVGREEELELLIRRWTKAKAGEGQMVLLSGEAGIGKSRSRPSKRASLVSPFRPPSRTRLPFPQPKRQVHRVLRNTICGRRSEGTIFFSYSELNQYLTIAVSAYRSTEQSFVYRGIYQIWQVLTQTWPIRDAERCIAEALELIETTKEKMFEPEVNRTAGEIAFKSERDPTTAQAYFERALAVARAQQAKSWELRAAMSMARLWRGQGKPQQGHELLAPVCGWFTEGFDTLDLKEAKALLEELAS